MVGHAPLGMNVMKISWIMDNKLIRLVVVEIVAKGLILRAPKALLKWTTVIAMEPQLQHVNGSTLGQS